MVRGRGYLRGTGDIESRRWTAIRAYGLLGPVHHEETLAALVDAMHRPPSAATEPGANFVNL